MSPGFTSPPNPAAFKAKVWEIARQIPLGKVSTYGQIGSYIPTPEGMNRHDYDSFAPRWVGGAMAGCPSDVPWQRVINAQGKISLRKGKGYETQRGLLEAEGIRFDERERVDLSRFGWEGPSKEWLKDHGLLAQDESPGPQLKLGL
jgi:methylated-DNA-protein-cysteine methyltransferase related protein